MGIVGLQRVVLGELMDDPALDRSEHLRALAGLRRINKASGVVDGMVRIILQRTNGTRQLRLLDVACGGGDVSVGVALGLKNAGINVQLTVVDRSNVAIEQACAAAKDRGLFVEGIRADAVAGLPGGTFDVVMNSLFLHHLERADAVRALANMHAAARRLVLISDLRRSVGGLGIAWIGCRVLSGSRVVHFDGPASVRAAWTPEEMRQMLAEAGMAEASVRNVWPWRMMIEWVSP